MAAPLVAPEMDMDILVAWGLQVEVQEESQEELEVELEEWDQGVGEDILVSQELPLGQSTAC